jgi:hypothetical protein
MRPMNRVVCAASTTHKRAQQSHEHRNAANRLAPIRSIRDRIRIPAARFRHFTENIFLAAPSVVGLDIASIEIARLKRNDARAVRRFCFRAHSNNPYFIEASAMSCV